MTPTLREAAKAFFRWASWDLIPRNKWPQAITDLEAALAAEEQEPKVERRGPFGSFALERTITIPGLDPRDFQGGMWYYERPLPTKSRAEELADEGEVLLRRFSMETSTTQWMREAAAELRRKEKP